MNLSHIILFVLIIFGGVFAFRFIKAAPKGMAFGASLMAVGIFWCATVLLSSDPVSNDIAGLGALFTQLMFIIIGCYITLIGSIFTAAAVYKNK